MPLQAAIIHRFRHGRRYGEFPAAIRRLDAIFDLTHVRTQRSKNTTRSSRTSTKSQSEVSSSEEADRPRSRPATDSTTAALVMRWPPARAPSASPHRTLIFAVVGNSRRIDARRLARFSRWLHVVARFDHLAKYRLGPSGESQGLSLRRKIRMLKKSTRRFQRHDFSTGLVPRQCRASDLFSWREL